MREIPCGDASGAVLFHRQGRVEEGVGSFAFLYLLLNFLCKDLPCLGKA